MDILNLTSATLSSQPVLPPALLSGTAALDRLQMAGALQPTQALLSSTQELLSELTVQQNLRNLMNLFASLMKNEHSPSGQISSSSSNSAPPLPAEVKKTAQATGTGYYPDNSAMEGGFVDRKGKKLNTLQDFLAGKADYVSVAMDKNENIPYGTKLRIPELEKKYGKPIEFRVVDTGGAFTGKGTSRIDICTANEKASTDPTINGPLTLQFV